jgi:light-harvesting complex I chlorophyll a/b binding protein 1
LVASFFFLQMRASTLAFVCLACVSQASREQYAGETDMSGATLASLLLSPNLAYNGKTGVPAARRPVLNNVGRVSDPGMFTGGRKATPKKVAPRKRSGGLSEINSGKGRRNLARNDGLSFEGANFDEVGVLPPLGRYDPLKIREQGPERYRRFVEMEIKHGRLAMAAFVGILVTLAGIRFPGEVATGVKFADIPGSAITSWAALPKGAWLSVLAFISLAEVSFFKQDPNKDAGDVVPDGWLWARYPDGYDLWLGDGTVKKVGEEEVFLGKTWKLNAERNNGRAAMMAVIGIIVHEILTGDPLYPLAIQDSQTITTLR